MKRLRVGLLGCGGIGARHAAAVGALQDEMQLVACCAWNESKVREFAARFGAESFTELRRTLDSQIDLLIVALPPFAHTGQVEQAVAAGTHVLVEKPIALDMTRAQSMVDAAAKSGVVAVCGFMYRFGAAVKRWDAAAKAGEAGRVGLFMGQFHCNALHADWWRERAKSGGQMVEQLIHIVLAAQQSAAAGREISL